MSSVACTTIAPHGVVMGFGIDEQLFEKGKVSKLFERVEGGELLKFSSVAKAFVNILTPP